MESVGEESNDNDIVDSTGVLHIMLDIRIHHGLGHFGTMLKNDHNLISVRKPSGYPEMLLSFLYIINVNIESQYIYIYIYCHAKLFEFTNRTHNSVSYLLSSVV